MYDVIADTIDEHQFSFLCPFCNARHRHGHGGDRTTHRIEHRFSHCLDRPRNIAVKIGGGVVPSPDLLTQIEGD